MQKYYKNIRNINSKFNLISLLMLGWIFILYEYSVRVSDSVIIQQLMHSFSIGPAQIGILSSAYYVPYILMQIPAGIFIDRYGIIKGWIFGLTSVFSGCYLFSISSSITSALFGRVLMGVGSSFAWVGVVGVICSFITKKKQAFFIGISMMLCMLGAILGQGPWLALTNYYFSWEEPYRWAALLGVILVIGILIAKKGSHLRACETHKDLFNVISSLMALLKSRAFWILAIYITVISLPQNAFSELWAVEFLKKNDHFQPQLAANLLSCIWIGGLIGAPVIGFLSSKVDNQRNLLVFFNIAVLVLTIILVFGHVSTVFSVGALLFLIGFCTNASVIVYALVANLFTKNMTSTAVSALNMFNMAGAMLIQLMIGLILSLTRTEGNNIGDFKLALAVMPITLVITLLLFYTKKSTQKKSPILSPFKLKEGC